MWWFNIIFDTLFFLGFDFFIFYLIKEEWAWRKYLKENKK